MKRLKLFYLIGICLFGFISTGAAETKLIIATGELPPYVSKQPENSFLTDLFREIANEMDVRFEFKFFPWKRCEINVEILNAWAAIPYVPTIERSQKFYFSEPLYTKQTKFFYYSPDKKKKNISYESLADLKNYRIGGVMGYFYHKMFIDAGITLELIVQEEQNFRKLQAGRVDLVPALEILGWHMIEELFSSKEKEKFFTVDKPLHVGANYLMTSKHYPDTQKLLAKFNIALKKIKKNGVYQQIFEKHGLLLAD